MKKIVTAFACGFAFSACALSTPALTDADYSLPDLYPTNSVTQTSAAYYQSLLDRSAAAGLPGIVMLVDGTNGFWAGSSGLIDIPNRVNAKKNSLFKIGSITKTFTAALTLILESEGKLKLDDPVSKYLPAEIVSRIHGGTHISIRQLLNHRSGIFNYSGYSLAETAFPIESYNDFSRRWTISEVLEYVYGKTAYFEPGAGYHYSNTDYLLLGLIIEAVEGRSFRETLSNKIFAPLQLTSAYSPSADDGFPRGVARGYQAMYGGSRVYDVSSEGSSGFPDGGIIADTLSVAKFFRALFELKLFGASQLNAMTNHDSEIETVNDAFFSRRYYGLGLMHLLSRDNRQAFYHNGSVPGFWGESYYFPDSRTCIVLLINCVGGETGRNWAFNNEIIWAAGGGS